MRRNGKSRTERLSRASAFQSLSARCQRKSDRNGTNCITARQKLTLGHAVLAHPTLANVDVYQSLGREFVSLEKAIISTIVPGSIKWLRWLRRPMLMDLAGNCFTADVMGAFQLAANMWYPYEGEEDDLKAESVNQTVCNILGL